MWQSLYPDSVELLHHRAKALPSKEAENVVEALREVCVFMCVCVCDFFCHIIIQICLLKVSLLSSPLTRGKSFTTVGFGIDHWMTTTYHPQANGLDERYNQTLVNSLSMFAQEDCEIWEAKLGEVVYAKSRGGGLSR